MQDARYIEIDPRQMAEDEVRRNKARLDSAVVNFRTARDKAMPKVIEVDPAALAPNTKRATPDIIPLPSEPDTGPIKSRSIYDPQAEAVQATTGVDPATAQGFTASRHAKKVAHLLPPSQADQARAMLPQLEAQLTDLRARRADLQSKGIVRDEELVPLDHLAFEILRVQSGLKSGKTLQEMLPEEFLSDETRDKLARMGAQTEAALLQESERKSLTGQVSHLLEGPGRIFGAASAGVAGMQRGAGALVGAPFSKASREALSHYSVGEVADAMREKLATGETKPGFEQPVAELFSLAVEKYGGDTHNAVNSYIKDLLAGVTDPVSYGAVEAVGRTIKGAIPKRTPKSSLPSVAETAQAAEVMRQARSKVIEVAPEEIGKAPAVGSDPLETAKSRATPQEPVTPQRGLSATEEAEANKARLPDDMVAVGPEELGIPKGGGPVTEKLGGQTGVSAAEMRERGMPALDASKMKQPGEPVTPHAERTREHLEAMSDTELAQEARSLDKTHVVGLGMGSSEFEGTYLSTEQSGNRYAHRKPDAVARAQADVKNPKVFRDWTEYTAFRKRFYPEGFDENATIYDPVAKGQERQAAKMATEELKRRGYDSVYLPESRNNEGIMVVFDRNKVKLSEPNAKQMRQPEAQPTTPAEPKQGYTRFYRADRADAPSAQGRGWAQDLNYVSEKYGKGQMGGETVWYTDVPAEMLAREYGDARAVGITDTPTLERLGAKVEPKLYRRIATPSEPPSTSPRLERVASEPGSTDVPDFDAAKQRNRETGVRVFAVQGSNNYMVRNERTGRQIEVSREELRETPGLDADQQQAVEHYLDTKAAKDEWYARTQQTVQSAPYDYVISPKSIAGNHYSYTILDKMREPIGRLNIEARDNGKTGYVRWVGDEGGSQIGKLGIKGVRELMTQLRANHPEFERITGNRISGAREAAVARRQARGERGARPFYMQEDATVSVPVERPAVETTPKVAEALKGKSLTEFVRSKQGIRPTDNAGELAAFTRKEGATTGVVNSRGKLTADLMREAADEAGYGPFESLSDFYNALRDDFTGRKPRHSATEADLVGAGEAEAAAGPQAALEPGRAERSFPKTAEAHGMGGGTDITYDIVRNKDVAESARALVEERGIDRAIDFVSMNEPGAETTAVGLATIRKLQDAGDYARAGEVIDTVAEQLTRQGQAIQAVKVIGEFAPERVAVTAQKILDRAGRGKKLSPEQVEQFTALGKDLQAANERVKTLEGRVAELEKGAKAATPRAARPKVNDWKARLDAQAATSLAEIKRLTGETVRGSGGPSTELLGHYAKYGAAKIARKGIDFVTWSAEMIGELGESVKPHIREIYRSAYEMFDTARRSELQAAKERAVTRAKSKTGPYHEHQIEGPPTREQLDTAIKQRELAIKRQAAARRELARAYERLTPFARARRVTADVINLPRALKASVDLSAPLRQGAIFVTEGKAVGRAFKAQIQALTSQGFERVYRDIQAHADFKELRDAKLEFTGKPLRGQGGLSAAEESFMTRFAEHIPVVKQSEQAYTAYLDRLRLDVASKYLREIKSAVKDPKLRQAEVENMARFVNQATGRGSLGKTGNAIAPVLNSVMFSPRYAVSRFQVLNPVTYAKMTPFARRIALRKMFQFTGLVATTMAIAKAGGAGVSLDPDSADFLKIKAGDTRFDLLAGIEQYVRAGIRLSKGFYNNATGGKNEERDQPVEVMKQFARSKLAPVPGAVADLATGRTFEGEPVIPHEKKGEEPMSKQEKFKRLVKREAVELFAPLFLKDAYEAWASENNVAVKSAATAGAFFGAGVQTYATKPFEERIKGASLDRAVKFYFELKPAEREAARELLLDKLDSATRGKSDAQAAIIEQRFERATGLHP